MCVISEVSGRVGTRTHSVYHAFDPHYSDPGRLELRSGPLVIRCITDPFPGGIATFMSHGCVLVVCRMRLRTSLSTRCRCCGTLTSSAGRFGERSAIVALLDMCRGFEGARGATRGGVWHRSVTLFTLDLGL